MRRRNFLKGTLLAGTGMAAGVSAASASESEAVPNLVTETEIQQSTSHESRQFGFIAPFDLRCESKINPLGMDASQPRLSWKLKSTAQARNLVQKAYRILVSTTLEGLQTNAADAWDSGKVTSPAQLHIEYNGAKLESGQRYYWSVQVWDHRDQASLQSEIAWFETGLLSLSDWNGGWIDDGKPLPSTDEKFYEDDPAPIFRRNFELGKPIKQARLYATALGYYDLLVNGASPSDIVLDPPWTSTDARVFYTTYDVTDYLQVGENVLGVMLGNGWQNPLPLRMWSRINIRESLPVGKPAFLSELVVEYEDGSSTRISSDELWRVTDGPLRRNSVYLGETYDARLEQSGWANPGFNDSGWSHCAFTPLNGSNSSSQRRIEASPIPPIRVTRTVAAQSVTEIQDGVFIFDLGQNFAGWARLRVQGPAGTTVTMRMGELLHADGTLNPMTAVAGQIKGLKPDGTPRGGPGAPEIAWQANSYTLRGDGHKEVYTPRFTFHGFRYVEVTGFPGKPSLTSIEGLRLNTDVEQVGSFRCSNERFNQIQEIVKWTFLSNLFSVQSDCPAREKYQYGGDIVASSEMAIFNYDVASFYAKAVDDFRDAARDGWFTETAPFVGIAAANYVQGAGPIGWGLAHPLLVTQLVQYYGDKRLVESNYNAAKRWVDLLEESSEGYIIDRCIGDHESLDPKPIELIATAQFHQATTMVAEMAQLLGRNNEARHYEQLSSKIRVAFEDRFVEKGTGRIGSATQAAQAAALYLNMVPDTERERAIQRMVEAVVKDHQGHLAAGIFGTKYLLNTLSSTGHADVVYDMVNQSSFPGWIHMLENGATTLWETWAQSDNVFSQNHPMFGSVSEWFFNGLGGIRPHSNAVGFNLFYIDPIIPKNLEWTEANYASVRGTVTCSWRKTDNQLHLMATVPVNSKAILRIPTTDIHSIQEGGDVLPTGLRQRVIRTSSHFVVEVELGSGRYSFTSAYSTA